MVAFKNSVLWDLPVADLSKYFRFVFVVLFLSSSLINVLSLTGSFFMIQMYDRVIPARSISTLVGLAIIPGMPVEAFIRTQSMPAYAYFAKPLTDQIQRAFREE